VIVYTSGYPDNAHLVAAAAHLFIADGTNVADVTYGKGAFWAKTDLTRFTFHATDLHEPPPHRRPERFQTADFRDLPYKPESMDTVVLDPPYVHNPGKHVTDGRYRNAETTSGMYHDDIINLYVAGMTEAVRVLKPEGGRLWVKCKDEVESSKQRWSHLELYDAAIDLGLFGRDLFVLTPNSKTTANRWAVQHHARKNHSFLWVFETGKAPRGVRRKAS